MKLVLCLLKVYYFFSIIRMSNLQLFTDNWDERNFTSVEENEESFNRTRRAIIVLKKTNSWEGGIIPYEFDSMITGQQQLYIKKMMRKWEKSTCIQFVLRNKQIHKVYLNFTKTERCKCCYFTEKKKIHISLKDYCYIKNAVVHELGHAIGFNHEHNRPDRDNFIKVQHFHIDSGNRLQYKKFSTHETSTLGTPYDYYSVMHYTKNILPIGPMSDSVLRTENLTPSYYDIAAANLLYQCCSCKKTLYEPSGLFEQPNIDGNGTINNVERCEWRIRAAEGERIELNISSLNFHYSYDCLLDYLEVRNGDNPNSVILARYCGKIDQARIIASNFLLVTWVKMSLHNTNGSFKAEYKTICGGFVDVKNDTTYNFESPNFPGTYQPNKQCNWNFTAPKNHQIVIKFNFFEIEKSEKCTKDYVQIIDGDDFNSPILGRYCDVKNSLKVKSTKNKLYVLFISDSRIQKDGFLATVTAVPITN